MACIVVVREQLPRRRTNEFGVRNYTLVVLSQEDTARVFAKLRDDIPTAWKRSDASRDDANMTIWFVVVFSTSRFLLE